MLTTGKANGVQALPGVMATNHFHFVTNWRIRGTIDEVTAVLRNPFDLPRWWPSVWISSEMTSEAQPGSPLECAVVTRGWMPVTNRWTMRVTENSAPPTFTIEATGDLSGVGVWTFVGHGKEVDVTFDWEVTARNPVLRLLSTVVRPLYASNFRWAMAKGQVSLERELAYRAARTDAQRAKIPPPPGPIPAAGAWATLALVLLSILLPGSLLLRLARRREAGRAGEAPNDSVSS